MSSSLRTTWANSVGLVGLPAGLRLEADAAAVGTAAFVAAAEGRRRPRGLDELSCTAARVRRYLFMARRCPPGRFSGCWFDQPLKQSSCGTRRRRGTC